MFFLVFEVLKFIKILQMGSYEKELERLNKLMLECLEEESEEEKVDDSDDDLEEDNIEVQEDNSDTEQEISDTEIEPTPNLPFFLGKDKKTKWSKCVPPSSRTRAENLIIHLPGPKMAVRGLKSAINIWKYFFDLEIIEQIVRYTNQHIDKQRPKFGDRLLREPGTNLSEMHCFIGLLYIAGVLKSGRVNIDELWNNDGTGVEIFRIGMSKFRFSFLLQHLRFDDMDTRKERHKVDKLAPIRSIFDLFVEKCKSAYTPFENVTIDEKLEAFRGRCGFRVYIPSKPNKYGLKVYALVDSKTYYACNLEVYVGSQPPGPYVQETSASAVVERLVEPLRNSKRNLTCDNWFTSIPLVRNLYSNYKLTFLGTIRKNKREIPLELSNPVKRPLGTSMFAFENKMTLVSYIPKKNKNVLLVSSLHHDDRIDGATGKPEMIIDYNSTKGGVDTLDKMCAAYDCARNTRRWPMVIFYSMLNIAGINSMVLFSLQNPGKNMRRRKFLHMLASELVEDHIRNRGLQVNIPKSIRLRISEMFGTPEGLPQPPAADPVNVRGRCEYCDRRKNRPTRFSCKTCGKFICLEHVTCVCADCYFH